MHSNGTLPLDAPLDARYGLATLAPCLQEITNIGAKTARRDS